MKSRLFVIPVLLVLSLALPSLALIKDSEHIAVTDPVMVAGTQLKPGTYHVTWEGEGPVVQVTFKQGDKVLVTTSATLVIESNPYDGALQMKNSDSSVKVLQGIQWKHKSLVFDQS